MRTPRHLPVKRRQRGYITVFVLSLAALVFLALGTALGTNSCLHEWNRRQAAQLQNRAAEIVVAP
jgi:hypothetical protein